MAAAAHPQSPPTPADFARPAEYEMVRISPDGGHLAVALRREGRLAVVVLRRGSLDVTASVNFDAPNEVDRFFWVNATRLVVTAARPFGPLAYSVPTGGMQAIDVDGRQQRWLDAVPEPVADAARIAPGAVRTPPVRELHVAGYGSGTGRAILLNRIRGWNDGRMESELVRLDVYDGDIERLIAGPRGTMRLFTDPSVTRFVALVRADDLSVRLLRADAESRRWQPWRAVEFQDGVLAPVSVDAAGRVWLADSSARDTTALVSTDADGVTQTHFAHDDVDVDLVMLDLGTGTPYAVRYVPDHPRYAILDGALAGHVDAMRAAFPDAWLELTSHTLDRRIAVFEVRAATMPARFYLSDLGGDGAAPTFLLDSRRWLPVESLVPTEPIAFTTRDGLRLHGYLTRPRGEPPHPLVALVHGGPHFVRDDGQFDETVQFLAAQGYAVLQVNFRGSGGYGKALLQAGFGHWGDLILDDVADGVAWAIDRGVTTRGRICIMGASFGGYAAVTSLVRHPSLYTCAIGLSAPYDLRDLLANGDVSEHRLGLEYLRTALGRDRAALDLASPIRQARSIRHPVLLGHGVLDTRAPIGHARRLARAIERAGGTVTRVEFEGEAHGLGATVNRERWFVTVRDFLHRHLPVRTNGHSL